MARLTKKDLKGILKECLREILLEENVISVLKEGKDNSYIEADESFQNNSGTKKLSDYDRATLKSRVLGEESNNNYNAPTKQNQQMNPMLSNTINQLSEQLSQGSGKNKNLFADILADTAMTTLQTQQQNGHSGFPGAGNVNVPYTQEQMKQDVGALSELAGGDIKHWAKVAFAKKK